MKQHNLIEIDTKVLFAFTPTNYNGDYPWFFNLTMVRLCGDVVLMVRLPTIAGGPCGEVASVRFTREMWREFVKSIPAANKVFEATSYLDAI